MAKAKIDAGENSAHLTGKLRNLEFYIAHICLFLWSLLPDGVLRSVVFVLGTVSFTLTV